MEQKGNEEAPLTTLPFPFFLPRPGSFSVSLARFPLQLLCKGAAGRMVTHKGIGEKCRIPERPHSRPLLRTSNIFAYSSHFIRRTVPRPAKSLFSFFFPWLSANFVLMNSSLIPSFPFRSALISWVPFAVFAFFP